MYISFMSELMFTLLVSIGMWLPHCLEISASSVREHYLLTKFPVLDLWFGQHTLF